MRADTGVQVVVVDDDPVERAGRAALLAGVAGVHLHCVLSPAQALEPSRDWDRVDVLLVDLWDARSTDFDHYPGVVVAAAARTRRPLGLREALGAGRLGEQLTVIAVSRHLPNSALNKRLVEAGVDLRFDRDHPSMREPELTVEVLCHPERHLKANAAVWDRDPGSAALGIGPLTRVNALVADAGQAEPRELFDGARAYGDNAERMRWDRRLKAMAAQHGLAPLAGRPSGGPHLGRGLSIEDFRSVIDVFRGTHPDGADLARTFPPLPGRWRRTLGKEMEPPIPKGMEPMERDIDTGR
ncbi:MAG: hypothetical protein ACRDY0_00155 [Acidimicrobiales bacterium]